MHLSLERKIAAAFVVGVVVLLGIGVLTWLSLTRAERAFALVEHTHVVLTRLEQIQVQVLEVQTGARGYALSGDEAFLAPFDAGVAGIRESLAAARTLTHDNPAQRARVARLAPLVEREIDVMSRRNAARRAGGIAADLGTRTLLEGKQLMDEIRAVVREMEAAENTLLAERAQAARRSAALTRGALLLAVAVALVLGAAAGARVQRDFRARRQADAALERSRKLFETFFEQSTDAIVVVDAHGVIQRVNRRTENLFSYARAELIGKPVETLMPARFRERHHAHAQGYQDAPKFRAMGAGLELFAQRQDGTEFPVDIMLSPLETDEGRVVLATIRDITERKAAAAALQRSAERIRDLYDRAPCGYHSLDPNGLVVDMNSTELAWLGYTREEIVGKKHFYDLVAPDYVGLFMRNFPLFKLAGSATNTEFQLQRKDGSTFYVSISAVALYDEQGNYVSSRSTLHDVTARRESEQRLAALHRDLQRHSDELEHANRDLEAFSYSVSHDLRAPLRHLAGFSALLAQKEGERLDAESRRLLGTIEGAAKKMGALIDALLDFSRLSRAPLQRLRVDTAALVASVIADGQIESAPDTVWQIEPLPAVAADPALLRQVWANLLGNAAKYAARATPPRVQVYSARDERTGEAVFAVQDNGVGFDPRYTEKLFKVFSRLHNDRDFRGTGIGLALVHRIVTRHGGRVWAEGRPGAGATFFFSLPDSIPAPIAPPALPVP
ncbi:MAG: PAS domain S-box protein [Opitutae bacterium]|nr:PAS domain S-box protein [Opitutae bacterium]